MKRTVLFQILVLTQLAVCAQRDCRTAEYRTQIMDKYPGVAQRAAAIEAFTKSLGQARNYITNGTSAVGVSSGPIMIPVVVHVLYNNSSQNISDAQVHAQIDILNQDYQRLNADTVKTAPEFRPVAASCGFRFELARIDTLGYATTGIVRRHTGISAFDINDHIKFSSMGGDDAWDRDRYLNIWVGNLTGGILGYSSVVGGPSANDGVVIAYTAFGTGGTSQAPFNKGRTATHEIGHWLNLIHTWGDSDCGDDLVSDTPPQQTSDRGCPSGVVLSCNNAPLGNMYANFMDFTNDECMNLFTAGQRDRMQALFAPGGERYPLLSSNVLTATPLASPTSAPVQSDTGGDPALVLYPNPATSRVTVRLTGSTVLGTSVEIYNQVGLKVMTASLTQETTDLNISSLTRGIYFLKVSDGKSGHVSRFLKM